MAYKARGTASGSGGGVTTLDGISGAITLVEGTGITITDNSPSAGDITITAIGGGGGDTITSPNSTITVGGTSSNTTLDINLSNANTWAALQTFGNNISFGGKTLDVTSLSSGNIIQYNGANWINVTPASIGAGVTSVSNSDGTLTISPTTGSVVASIAALTSGDFLVGNGSNIATGVAMSGDATLADTGAVTLATVNSNVGTFQGLTVNGKGQVTAAVNENYLTANQTITLSGDATGSGTTAITATLATVNSNVGTYQGMTINGKGLVTAAVNEGYTTGIQYVSGTSAVSSNSTSVTTSSINTSGANLIVAVVGYLVSAGAGTFSDSASNTWIALTGYSSATNGAKLYYCINPITSSTQTFTVSGATNFPSIAVQAFSGVATTGFDQATGNNNGAGALTIQPGSVLGTQNNELVITGVSFNHSDTLTINSGFSTPQQTNFNSGNGYGIGISYLIQGTTASVNPTWTVGTSTNMASAIATFAAATSPGVQQTESANVVYAGPSSGGAALPTFRSLVAADIPSNDRLQSITVNNGSYGGSALSATGVIAAVYVPYACTIQSVTLLADKTGSVVVDIWVATYSLNTLPTVSNTITASDLPTLSSAQTYQDSTLSGWTTSIAANSTVVFNVNSVSTIGFFNLVLKVLKT